MILKGLKHWLHLCECVPSGFKLKSGRKVRNLVSCEYEWNKWK